MPHSDADALSREIVRQGLTQGEAAERLRREGPNELPRSKRRQVLILILSVFKEPMIALLVITGGIYLILGDREEALLLVASIGVIAGIEFFQERRTDRALEALRDLSSPRARVVRDGEARRIPGREVVCGDVVLVSEGDRVPADGEVLSSTNLTVDESLLTGESVPVRKSSGSAGEETARAYSGTLVVRGNGALRNRPGPVRSQ